MKLLLAYRERTVFFSNFRTDVMSLPNASSVACTSFANAQKMFSLVIEAQASFALEDLNFVYVLGNGIL